MAADALASETELAEFGILGPLEVSRSGRAVPLGGPRQRAVLALLLLEANRVVSMDRLAEDHANARLIAERLAESRRITIDLATAQTNILVFSVAEGAPDAATVVARAKERGLLLFAFGPLTLRAVTHLDVTREQCRRAAEILVELVEA